MDDELKVYNLLNLYNKNMVETDCKATIYDSNLEKAKKVEIPLIFAF